MGRGKICPGHLKKKIAHRLAANLSRMATPHRLAACLVVRKALYMVHLAV